MRWSERVGSLATALATLTAATTFAACGRKASGPPAPSDPPYVPLAANEPVDVGAPHPSFERFAAALSEAAAAGDRDLIGALVPGSLLLEEWLAEQRPDRRIEVAVTRRVELADRTLAHVELHARAGHAPPDSFSLPVAVEHASGRAQLVSSARSVGSLIGRARVDGDLRLDLERPWVRGDLSIIPEQPADRFVLTVPAPGMRIAVEQDGAPARFAVVDDMVVVDARSGRASRFTLHYEGTPAGAWLTAPDDRSLVVRDATGMPRGVAAGLDLRIHHRDGTMVRTPLPLVPAPSSPGWRTVKVRGESTELEVWLARDRTLRSGEIRVGDTDVTFEAPPDLFDATRAEIEHASAALAPLGPRPGRLHLVVVAGLVQSEHVSGLITVSSREFERDARRAYVFAHELAHVWFGGTIPLHLTVATRWWEMLATYVGTWALTDEQALEIRTGLLAALHDLPEGHVRPSAPARGMRAADSERLSYMRGGLLLTALERRVGRPAMIGWLRELIRTRTGLPTTLADVVASVGPALGVEHQRWLEAWLAADRPATVTVENLRREGDRVRADLVADLPVERLTIEIATGADGRRMATHQVALVRGANPIDLPVADGATNLYVNSDAAAPVQGAGMVGVDLNRLAPSFVDPPHSGPFYLPPDVTPSGISID